MLKQRVLTAAIGLMALVVLLGWAPKPFLILMFLIFVSLSTYEAAHMLLPRLDALFSPSGEDIRGWGARTKLHVALCVVLAVFVFAGSAASQALGSHGFLIVGILLTVLLGVFSAPAVDLAMGRTLGFLFCVVYGTLPWLAIWDLYLLGDGSKYLVFLMAVVWAGDTGAYFGGLKFGRHKLAPVLSPKKTIEGAIAGLLASLVGGCVVQLFWGLNLGTWNVVMAASLLGGASGQLGDLAESLLKRFSGVKDSGSLLPGHGGFLDRVDGLLFAAPLIWAILYLHT